MSDDRLEKVKALYAVIFAADEPCDEPRLSTVLAVPLEQVEGLLAELREMLEDGPLQLVKLAGGYHLATRPQYAEYIQRLREPEPERLSRQAMEALAIIAYRQPITRPEIDDIRGVDSSSAVNSLLAKGLVAITGRRDAPGRPFMFSTTPHFLSAFGLSGLEDLPRLSEPDADLLEQLAEQVAEDDESVADEESEGSGEDGEDGAAPAGEAPEQAAEDPDEQ